jgi:hypothetical protein
MRAHSLARIGCAIALTGSLSAFTPLAAAGASAAPPAPSWHLVGHHQRACFDSNVHDAWFGVFISGTWTHAINVGLQRLPSGGTFSTSYTPVAAGTSAGTRTLAYADAKLTSNPPVGTYKAVLWASDGSTRDRVTVELDVTADCGY